MARASIWLQKFDRSNDFVVVRPITVRGTPLVAGDIFDKTAVTTRTLRQLFEARKIKVAVEDLAPVPGKIVKHIGRGRFAVFGNGERLTAEPLTREEADAYAAA